MNEKLIFDYQATVNRYNEAASQLNTSHGGATEFLGLFDDDTDLERSVAKAHDFIAKRMSQIEELRDAMEALELMADNGITEEARAEIRASLSQEA